MDVDDREQDFLRFGQWVAASPWRFAKTYVTSFFHEYALRRVASADFDWAIGCIERWGEARLQLRELR